MYEQKPLDKVKGSTDSPRCMSPALHSRGQALHLKLSLSGAPATRGTMAARRTRRATRAGAHRPMKCICCHCAHDCWPPGSALPHPAHLGTGSVADMRIWHSPSSPTTPCGAIFAPFAQTDVHIWVWEFLLPLFSIALPAAARYVLPPHTFCLIVKK